MSPLPRRPKAPPTNPPYTLRVSDVEVTVVRKVIKNLYLRIPRNGPQVEVKAPLHVSDAYIVQVVEQRLDWIRGKLRELVPVRPPMRYETGDELSFQGRPVRLEVVHRAGKKPTVTLGTGLSLCIDPAEDTLTLREAAIYAFYRRELARAMQPVADFWQAKTGFVAHEWRLKRMTTRWGTCNPRARRIWLSVELAKVSPACLEYVIVHEIAHLYEPSHNHRFRDFMSRYLPDWRERRKQLNRHGGSDCFDEADANG